MSERDELVARMRDIVQACRHDPFSIGLHTALHSLAQRAADAIERDGARIAELERGEILTNKELVSAIVTAVMSKVQSDRDDALRKVQRHIIRVEQERDERSEHRALAERRIVELEAEVARLTAEQDAISANIGGNEYLDPPDGGNVSLAEQVRRMRADILALREQIAALESREVCTVAHDNVGTCGYCQRDALLARVEAAEKAIERVLPAKAREHIDCWKVNYGLDRYDKVTAARRWAEAGGPSDGPIMALATAIEWLEST